MLYAWHCRITMHLLLIIIGPLIVSETIAIPGTIFLQATLSFIGLGVHVTTRGGLIGLDLPSWGVMICAGYPALWTSPYLILLPNLALILLTVAFNFMVTGCGLRSILGSASNILYNLPPLKTGSSTLRFIRWMLDKECPSLGGDMLPGRFDQLGINIHLRALTQDPAAAVELPERLHQTRQIEIRFSQHEVVLLTLLRILNPR